MIDPSVMDGGECVYFTFLVCLRVFVERNRCGEFGRRNRRIVRLMGVIEIVMGCVYDGMHEATKRSGIN